MLLFVNCNNSQKNKSSENSRIELVPEPDKAERLKYEALQKLKNSGCNLKDPDTSVCGIKLRDFESAIRLIGQNDKIDSLDQYKYYSKLDREILTLTQHPGDGKFQISIFKIKYSNKVDQGYRQLNIDTFKTEKGIKLGMNKKEILGLLGNCYAPIDSTKNYIEIYYRIISPNDSKSKILESNNMPIYYASYKFWNDTLKEFEFGFEYP